MELLVCVELHVGRAMISLVRVPVPRLRRLDVINKVPKLKCFIVPEMSVPEATRMCGRNVFASMRRVTNLCRSAQPIMSLHVISKCLFSSGYLKSKSN
jgi:hypothetical protein